MPRVLIKAAFKNIRFKCLRCGTCCHHKRPTEFGQIVPLERLNEFWEKSNLIYLTGEDIRNICSKTGRDTSYFVDTLYDYDGKIVHVEDSGKKIILDFPVMKSKPDTTCVFYDNGCTIYSARPIACRLFPFRVEEETTADGDMILNIRYNETCPGMGAGKMADRKALEKMVADQFKERSESVAAEVRSLVALGMISGDAKVYRSHPGR
ncbi:MAG TPA: YkgJ family cysteine cluster protein [Methanothrix sp.]|nr:YkgJ family cysteine cluster protein [Methanothrix sp.]HPT37075.1 YkgJ family cysteine cluster protein [Methanothrix sp.]